jgi:hypothetical protein
MNIHPNARTTPKIRAEIRASCLSRKQVMEKYNVGYATAAKWLERDDVEDRTHRPHKLQTTLTELQELIIVYLRTTLLLSLDDLFAITREHIKPDISRAALHRCLVRHDVGNLRALMSTEDKEQDKATKAFKAYPPGFIHIDIKYLPQMPDEQHRRYLFVYCASR